LLIPAFRFDRAITIAEQFSNAVSGLPHGPDGIGQHDFAGSALADLATAAVKAGRSGRESAGTGSEHRKF
jgi:hypothetical protein